MDIRNVRDRDAGGGDVSSTAVGRRQIPRTLVGTSLALVVLSGLITTISIVASPSDSYLAVALSDIPLNKIKPDRKRLLVELIRQGKATSHANSPPARAM